ncbi:MAG: VOC family protein [Actinobacteria bacterium]|nr:VOC family protein [Actinomycetota bacterium]
MAARSVGLNHVGLCVRDVAAAVAFYRDVAGFEVRVSPFRMAGEWFDTLTWNDGAEIEVAMLALGGFTLQLVGYHAAGADPVAPGHNHPGNPHLCIDVDDVEAKHAEVAALGAHRPTVIVDIVGTGARSFYVQDPDGTPVEFLQMPAR